MSKENLERFLNLVGQAPALQAQLNAAPDNASFVKLAVELGTEKGYSFTAEQVRAQMAAAAGQAEGELSEEQLEKVSKLKG